MNARSLFRAGLSFAFVAALHAEVVIETVPVGNPGNLGEWAGSSVLIYGNTNGAGVDRNCGAVSYPFEMGKYEITIAQYVEFLNAVAANDPYGLYNTGMGGTVYPHNIIRFGSSGSYTYQIGDGTPAAIAHWGNRPVGYIAWCDAARFANWMENGQPSGLLTGNGAADAWLTEDGTYATLGAPPSGANSNVPYQALVRRPGATWVLPSEDEWYKAAYHKNDGNTANYFDYPTQSNAGGLFDPASPDNNVIDPDPGNSANYHIANPDDDCVGTPYSRTDVGEFENSPSPYGTFDQGGNVWEWTDTRYARLDGSLTLRRIMRGASFYPSVIQQQPDGDKCMHAAWRQDEAPVAGTARYGFRLAKVNNDCNGNGTLDYDDVATGSSHDYNYNGVLDECDIASSASQDCNENGIPDEAEVGLSSPPPYFVDDGTPGFPLSALSYLGEETDGYLLWMNHFVTAAGRESIDAISTAFIDGYVPIGTEFTVYVWHDEGGLGNPGDTYVLTSHNAIMTAGLDVVDIPNTNVGPAGSSFFIGILMHITDVNATSPASFDDTTDQRESWIAWGGSPIDPDNLGTAPNLISTHELLGYGNFMIRALPLHLPAQLADADQNGVPDVCDQPPCTGDLNGDGNIGLSDLASLLANFGTPSGAAYEDGDLDGDGAVNLTDLSMLLTVFGSACP